MGFQVACLPAQGFPSFPRPRVQHQVYDEEVEESAF